ncbi:TPA: GNAT family N-acetyltransferase [Streptococcus agalactiae]|uniref:GNAT family N-acetyltransferase n=1 Tax=Streptococcus TaxID=1301 RepID=UPI00005C60AF|nr:MULTISPECIES: GNAT family N-acetyltransferase [Streptococcus]CCW43097.1 Acetyltransferase [Streptococcus agalactiae ILRI112]AMD33200.1 GNAT family acetyltransferase [Streptococcus agalactiae]AOF51934.1 GNAT family acetyltransferase [Streptococcus agalactiae]ARC23858.1 GNAT family acetyltransferase [Streptococcus sp. 'group B']ASA95170.1 GNAT family acetyltransferase [Streptococcus agalactiae]
MKLRRPVLEDKEEILAMYKEFQKESSSMDGGFYEPTTHFEDWLDHNLNMELGIGVPDNFVPYIQFVSFDNDNNAIGFLNLRLRLNDTLLEKGGHIGYSIRPRQRGKGYAKEQLKLGIEQAHLKNINEILVTCHVDNDASKSVILANGGILEDCRHQTERYWIT